MFLANLNLVLGCLLPPTPNGLVPDATFNLISCQPNSTQDYNPHAQLLGKGPTCCLQALKKKQSKIKIAHCSPSIPSVKQTKLSSPKKDIQFDFRKPTPTTVAADLKNSISTLLIAGQPTSTIRSCILGPKKTSRELLRFKQKINKSIFNVLTSGNLDYQLCNLAINYACDKANDHLFFEPPSNKMNKEHDLEGCSDEEVDDPLDQEESEWDHRPAYHGHPAIFPLVPNTSSTS
ncbi:hypothetical protein MJO28_006105 [Puccinia striiformis f. sp. tritici]|uniref:Uncharacterized protein n=1 Tax=Puccinia striiformis f. sp. tritici TaxID=168172 RepID=A0ACC0EGH3_9BASI|nr:hypothetical protein MJO28_006105 [Puccinia striiformis f. sp. tritici]